MLLVRSCVLSAPSLPSLAGPGAPVLVWLFNLPQFSSVAQSCLTPCDPMDCSKPGFPVLHYLQEPAQTHVLIW